MKDSLFIIAIGGTGMRCLEAFVHLCAVGMFDNEEINILTLDTDQSNGNKGRVERLIELYNKVKTDNHVKEIKWNDPSKIDTSMDAVGKVVVYQATVTFVDGSTTEITVPVFVTPEDKDQYTPTIMPDVTVKKGDLIAPESVVTNQDDLPKETTIAWQTAPDTSKPGQTTGVVVITYPDKSYVEFTVMVQVKDSIPWTLIVPGQKDSVKDTAIANGHVKHVTP